jgi:hypothetical protein
MTSISVTSIKKAIFEFQEDSTQFTTQQSRFPSCRLDGPEKRPDAYSV